MKKKLLALVCALVMIFSLASCGLSTPDTVGKVGDFEVSSGLYLLAQFSAYQQAAQLADKDQDATDVKAFLKATITTDADSGETAVVQDYVADKTLETLRTFAAIDARFAELGGELTAEQTQVADNYAQQLMDQYGSTYTANGIGLETLKAFERIQLKHTLLLTLVYGPDGESPVDDSDLTEHLDSQMYELAYVNIPPAPLCSPPTTRRPRCCSWHRRPPQAAAKRRTARCPSRSAPCILPLLPPCRTSTPCWTPPPPRMLPTCRPNC